MRKLLLALALTLAGQSQAFAAWPNVQDAQNSAMDTLQITVFNDSGGLINSGSVVVWDQADGDVVSSLRPYVTTSTTASDPYTAGVIPVQCANQTQCPMVIYGITLVRVSGTITAGDLIAVGGGTATAVDHTAAADNRSIGTALVAATVDSYSYIPVFVSTMGTDGQ